MTTKTTGAELKKFYNDSTFWPTPGGAWHEDETIEVDGVPLDEADIDSIPDTVVVKVTGGIVLGLGPEPGGDEPSFEAYFKRWRRQQNTVTFLVSCDKAFAAGIKEGIKIMGGRVG